MAARDRARDRGVGHLRLRHLAGRAALRGLRPGARPRGGEEEADRAAAAPRARRGPGPGDTREPQLRLLPHRRGVRARASPRCSRRSTTSPNGRASTRGCSSAPRSGSTAAARAARCFAATICARRRHGSPSRRRTRSRSRRRCRPSTSSPAAPRRPGASGSRRGGGRRGRDRRGRDRRRASAPRRPARPRAAGANRTVATARRRRRPTAADRPRVEHPARRAGRFGEPDGRGGAVVAQGTVGLATSSSPFAATERGSVTRRSALTGPAS